MTFVVTPSQLCVGGADELPHYTGPYISAISSPQRRTMACADAPVAGNGGYTLSFTMSSAIDTPVHPHGPPAIGSTTSIAMPVLRDVHGLQGSSTPPSVIATPINAASTIWRTQVCPNAPLQRHGVDELDPSSIRSTPGTPIDKWPSNIGTPTIVFSAMNGVPNPDALRFAICGAKLDLAGASALVDASAKDSEVSGLRPVIRGEPQGKGWIPHVQERRHTDEDRFASGLDTVPESEDVSPVRTSEERTEKVTILGSLPAIDVDGFESPEKLVAPVGRRARNAQKPRKNHWSRSSTE